MIPIDQDTTTTPPDPRPQPTGPRDGDRLAARRGAHPHRGFLRQAKPAELDGIRAAAAAARSAGIDVVLIAAALHHRALTGADCGHGYRVTDSCPMCDGEADELHRVTEQLLHLDQPGAEPTAYQGTQAPTICPRCDATDQWSAAAGLVLCTACGYRDEMPEVTA